MAAKQHPGYVYFLKAGNVVKIGFTQDLRNRERQLQTGNSERAFICKWLAGDRVKERSFHRRFAEYRLRGEWFDLRGRLAKYLELNVSPVMLAPRAAAIEVPVKEPIGYL